MEIAASFFNFGVLGTRDWIKKQNPSFSELEVTLEFVRMSYEAGQIEDWHWNHFQKIMQSKIRKDSLRGCLTAVGQSLSCHDESKRTGLCWSSQTRRVQKWGRGEGDD